MKKVTLVIIAFLIFSCSDDNVRKMAVEYNVESPIKWLVVYYSRCYYRLPENQNDLVQFINDCQESGYGHPSDMEIIQLLEHNKIKMSSYLPDSLFLYCKSGKCGACIYGHPLYWLRNIEKWPKDKNNYLEQFLPAIFNIDGKYIFETDYQEYRKRYEQLWHICQVYLPLQEDGNKDLFRIISVDFNTNEVSYFDNEGWVSLPYSKDLLFNLAGIVREIIPPETPISRAILPIRNMSVPYINPSFEAYGR